MKRILLLIFIIFLAISCKKNIENNSAKITIQPDKLKYNIRDLQILLEFDDEKKPLIRQQFLNDIKKYNELTDKYENKKNITELERKNIKKKMIEFRKSIGLELKGKLTDLQIMKYRTYFFELIREATKHSTRGRGKNKKRILSEQEMNMF